MVRGNPRVPRPRGIVAASLCNRVTEEEEDGEIWEDEEVRKAGAEIRKDGKILKDEIYLIRIRKAARDLQLASKLIAD